MCFHVTFVALDKQYVLCILSVSVALCIQHAMRMRHTAICVLSGYTLYFHIISKGTIRKN
jgi:hypothetical protein